MPHGQQQREGPYGPPPIQREMPPYEAPPYWGPPPPAPVRYPRQSHRAPPPPDYHHHAQRAPPPGTPPGPPPPSYHHPHVPPPPHHPYSGAGGGVAGVWREPPEPRHYPSPYPHAPPPVARHHPSSHMSRRDMPPPPAHRDDYGRPYMPMDYDHSIPPPPAAVPRAPPIQFRPTSKSEHPPFVSPAPAKKSSSKTSSKTSSSGGKKKKGDALSLLAKVSTAMADPEEEEEADKENENKKAAGAARRSEEEVLPSPPRRSQSPLPTMWSTPKQPPEPMPHHVTPTHDGTPRQQQQQQHYGYHYPPRYGGPPPPQPHHLPPHPHHHPHHPHAVEYGPPPPQYHHHHHGGFQGPPISPTVISERGSFEDPEHRAFGSPVRHDDPHHYAPYTYVQQPRLEDKTILRKKFSWKHYPELERFLIANRDEYLRHSALNYTSEQKQYNNWLTEHLLEVAARHHYVFCPQDFNFVAIRDRIRCYYKSYVQTARKRGLPLVTDQPEHHTSTTAAAAATSSSASKRKQSCTDEDQEMEDNE